MAGPNVYAWIPWDVIDYDTNGFFNPVQNTRITIPIGIRRVQFHLQGTFSGEGGGTDLAVFIRRYLSPLDLIGTIFLEWTGKRSTLIGIGMGRSLISPVINVEPGQWFQVQAYHNFFGLSNFVGGNYSKFGLEVYR